MMRIDLKNQFPEWDSTKMLLAIIKLTSHDKKTDSIHK